MLTPFYFDQVWSKYKCRSLSEVGLVILPPLHYTNCNNRTAHQPLPSPPQPHPTLLHPQRSSVRWRSLRPCAGPPWPRTRPLWSASSWWSSVGASCPTAGPPSTRSSTRCMLGNFKEGTKHRCSQPPRLRSLPWGLRHLYASGMEQQNSGAVDAGSTGRVCLYHPDWYTDSSK